MLWTTACQLVDRVAKHLSSTVLLTTVSLLTIGNGAIFTLIVIMGECAGSGSAGCTG